MSNESLYTAALHACGCTQRDLKVLHSSGKDMQNIWETWGNLETAWITTERRTKITTQMSKYDLTKLAHTLDALAIRVLTSDSADFPDRIRNISQSPYVLYVRGNLKEMPLALGIVGSRSHTAYGDNALRMIIGDLPSDNIAIISGGAHGIDTLSHTLALEQNIYTISVFGCGVDIYYPATNRTLFEKILSSGGALISQFPIGTRPEPYMFPMRNEIISGLSDGVVIPEAGEKSGTLITAGLALEQGKDVFAVPGDIFRETSRGCNLLIAKGEAKCILSAVDILDEYLVRPSEASSERTAEERTFSTEHGRDIFALIEGGTDTPESILTSLTLSLDILMMELSLLEIDGHISLGVDGKYSCRYF